MRPRNLAEISAVWFLLLAFPGGYGAQDQEPRQQASPNQENAPAIEAANVLFRYSPQLAVFIVRLRGSLIPTDGHTVPSFNDPASFVIGVEAAEIRMASEQLAVLMNTRLAGAPRAQVKNVRIAVAGGQLLIDGTMKEGLHIPFHAIATVGLTNDNRIRIDVRQVKVVHVSVKGVLAALGLSMEDLVSQKGLRGMSVKGDSFLIDPQTAFPPPQIRAKVTDVRVAGNGIVLMFGNGVPHLTMGERGNYIALRGGRIQYGRDEMFDSDLTMTDSTPADPFEFYLGQYWTQMVASTIRVTPDKALRIRVPDYSKIPH